MISGSRLRQVATLALTTIVAASLTGCATEYHGYDSGIDGVLWRQVAAFEDPLSKSIYEPARESTQTPDEYLAGIDQTRWDGTARALPLLGNGGGGVLLYDVASKDLSASFSLFIASGPRPDISTDDGRPYLGPSEVYTCYSINVDFGITATRSAIRTVLKRCPAELVGLLAKDAAYASAEVFDG